MKYYIIAIVVLMIAFVLLFQLNKLPEKWQDFTEQIDSDFKGYEFLTNLCTKVGGRISGTEKGNQAEDLVINNLKSFGYENIFLHKFEHIGWERQKCSLIIKDEKDNIIKTIEAKSLGLTPQNTQLKLPLIYVSYGTKKEYDSFPTGFFKNKIVLVDKNSAITDTMTHRCDKVEYARRNKASAIIIFSQYLGNVITTSIASFGVYSDIPAISICREDGFYLEELLETDNTILAEINVENKRYSTFSRNISVDIPGAEKEDEVVMISAHLDSWELGQGAVDNGANVAMLLELARQFKKLNIKPKRTVRFMFFMAEEFGLIGSKKYIQENPGLVNELFYVLNLEMNIDPKGINLLLDDRDRNWFENLTKQLNPLGMQNEVITKPWLESDQTYFMLSGIPTLTFEEKFDVFSGYKYHSRDDNLDLVDPENLKNSVKIFGIVLQEIANSSQLKKWHMSKNEIEAKIKNSKIEKILNFRNITIQ